MVPQRYRLDYFSAHLCGRLEGMRKSYLGREDEMLPAFRRVANEELEQVSAEFRELMGDEEDQAGFLRQEVMETFLPRYTRMARLQNKLDAGTTTMPEIGVRLLGLLAGILAALVALRMPPALAFLRLVGFFAIPAGIMLPDIQLWLQRRRWQAQLDELVADMSRIQVLAGEYRTLFGVESAPSRLERDEQPGTESTNEPQREGEPDGT